jgi:hypothetical protein
MKYLLVVGFACDVYRREPRARIFFGDKLIDEFYISHHKDTLTPAIENFQKNLHILHPFSFIEVINNFPPLRFYEIGIDTTLDQTELRIEIENSDSNLTNGFINNSTLIKIQVCYFFPLHQKLLLKFHEIKNENRLTQKYAWYQVYKNQIFDLLVNGLYWQGKNGQIVESDGDLLKRYNLGGDGVFTCQLVKKYQILMSKLKKSRIYNFNSVLVDYYLNKYNEYANQRNTN